MDKIIDVPAQKKLVAKHCVDILFKEKKIFSGMKIGLGTGSTAICVIKHIADLIDERKLNDIFAVPTSYQTLMECEKFGIPIYSLNSKQIDGTLDLTIDGADEITPEKYLIKGGGAALLKEKIIAYNSKNFVIIADETKKVNSVGTGFALPIEIVPEAMLSIIKKLEMMGVKAVLREGIRKMGPVITDNGNFIIDARWIKPISEPDKMENILNSITGIVENGLFTKLKPHVFIAYSDGTVEDF